MSDVSHGFVDWIEFDQHSMRSSESNAIKGAISCSQSSKIFLVTPSSPMRVNITFTLVDGSSSSAVYYVLTRVMIWGHRNKILACCYRCSCRSEVGPNNRRIHFLLGLFVLCESCCAFWILPLLSNMDKTIFSLLSWTHCLNNTFFSCYKNYCEHYIGGYTVCLYVAGYWQLAGSTLHTHVFIFYHIGFQDRNHDSDSLVCKIGSEGVPCLRPPCVLTSHVQCRMHARGACRSQVSGSR